MAQSEHGSNGRNGGDHPGRLTDPAQLGDALMLLMEGCYVTRLTFGAADGPMANAAATAHVLLDAYIPPQARGKA